MQTQQTVEPIYGATASSTNSYPIIVSGPQSTPDYRAAIPWQGMSDILGALNGTLGAANHAYDEIWGKAQQEADNNARMRFERLYNVTMSSYQPSMDDDAAKTQIDGMVEKLQTAADDEKDVSAEQRTRFTSNLQTAREELALRQRYGKVELIARDARNLWNQGLQQSIENGDDAKVDEYLADAKKKGYIVPKSADDLHSQTALNREIYNRVNDLDIPHLNALSEQLTEDVDAKGNSTLFPAMKRNQNIEAVDYVRGVKAEKVKSADAKLEEMERNNTLTPQTLEDMYQTGQIAGHQYRAFQNDFDQAARKLYASQEKDAKDKKAEQQQLMKNQRYILQEQIEAVPWTPDANNRNCQYEQMLTKINQGGFDPQYRVELKNVLKRSRNEFESGEHFKQDDNYKLGVDMITQARKGDKLFMDPDGLFNKKSDDDFQNARMAELHTAFTDSYRQNPDQFKSPEAVQNFIRNRIAALNAGKVQNLMQQTYSAAPLTAGDMSGNQSQPRPQSGAIVGGYRYLGGDPATKTSWETVKE